jgi:hypothetical protein
LDDWIERKVTVDHVDMDSEFTTPPQVSAVDVSVLQIIFECTSNAFLWKGLMVELARELDMVDGIERVGFWDLVAGAAHPASVRD